MSAHIATISARVGALVGLVLLLAGCGTATSSTPSPEAIATAESVSRDITIGAPYSTTPETEDAGRDTPIVLDGRVFGHGPTGVILAHMRPADQTAWFPFATMLAATGQFTVMTFDFRGFGDSTGEKEFDRIDTDLDAAYAYMRVTLGQSKVFLVGASMGGTASLVLAAREQVAGVVSISAQDQFLALDAASAVPAIAAPKLFVTSKNDVPADRSQMEFWDAAAEPKEQYVYDGAAHGTDLFAAPTGADLTRRLIAFLTSH